MQCRAIKEMKISPEVSPIIALLLTETICLIKKPQGSRSMMLGIHSEMLTRAVFAKNLLCLITQTNRLQLHKLPLCLHLTPCKPSTTTSLAL